MAMNTMNTNRIIFITGTDTAAGKTVLTALLLSHLRRRGHRALAIKPFCSGGRADAELLQTLQAGELSLDEINPFHFAEPLAPLVAARKHRRNIPLATVLEHVRSVLRRRFSSPSAAAQSFLLIEGVGGLLVPLGKGYTVLDLVSRLARKAATPGARQPAGAGIAFEVLVAARNRVGTLNHTLLTVRALRDAGIRNFSVVLMDGPGPEPSAASNPALLAQLLSPAPVHRIPYLGRNRGTPSAVRRHSLRLARMLGRLVAQKSLAKYSRLGY
jgi:dethiobiotin synthetase